MAVKKGALPAASLGPPPTCRPIVFTLTAGSVGVPGGGSPGGGAGVSVLAGALVPTGAVPSVGDATEAGAEAGCGELGIASVEGGAAGSGVVFAAQPAAATRMSDRKRFIDAQVSTTDAPRVGEYTAPAGCGTVPRGFAHERWSRPSGLVRDPRLPYRLPREPRPPE